MKTQLNYHLIAALLGVVFTAELHAVPLTFTYQGQLTDNGIPANGIYDFRFELWYTKGSVGVTTNPAVTVSNGLFTVMLDFGIDATFFRYDPLSLEIGVRTNGGGPFNTLSPRQEITSAPYAIQAENAWNAEFVTGDVNASHLVGIIPSDAVSGDYSNAVVFNNPGNVFNGTFVGNFSGLLGINSLDAADGSPTNAVYVDTEGYVGIGTLTPREKLEVQGGDVRIQGVDGFDAPGESAYLFLGSRPDYVKATRNFGINLGVLGAPDVVTIQNQTGNVGIGTTNPATALHVVGMVKADAFDGSVAASQLSGTISSNNIGAGSITSVMLAAEAVGADQLTSGAVTADALADGAVTAAKMATVSNWFALTIANPRPATSDRFGWSVAAVGADRVLIGASSAIDAGAAYLLNTDSTLLTTFTNPASAAADYFGYSVAAVGTNRVLIGAEGDDTGAADAGAAYLFNTDGALLTTFTNPTPAAGDYFGRSVAAVGSDGVLIGAYQDHTGAANAGAAYLFGTNGALLTTFTNPTPADGDFFGVSVASVGTERVLIGAYRDNTGANTGGAAYLFSTNGALLTTFTNPTPAINDYFGNFVAAVGSDRVLIGARGDDTGATNAGAAYLFSTNGALLTTFTNPTPATSVGLGISIAAVGNNLVLIGAYRDGTGASSAGAAYLFSTNGALLTTFTNPAPADGDWFGFSVAAVGTNGVLVGASLDDMGAPDAGAAYLFSMQTFTTGLVAEAVAPRSVSTASLEDGAVTLAKLDPTIGVWTRSGEDVYRLTGNVGIGTANPANKLQVAGDVSAMAFITTSDRHAKENLAAISPLDVLSKVTALPISTWNFKESKEGRHIGPMAQDFKAAFGLGKTDTGIATVDADGVALAAIQGLNKKVEAREQQSEARTRKLEAENAELRRRLEELERLVTSLTSKSSGGAQ